MAGRKRAKTFSSSPLATVQDIQRRLVRPSSSSPPPTSTFSSREDVQISHNNSSKSKVRTTTTTKKLEDYLDCALLSEVSSKLSHAKKVPEKMRSQKKKVRDFEWPVNELKVLVESSDTEAVNLKDDLDLIQEFGDGDVEPCNNPFRRFEQIATRRFKG